MKLSHVLTTFAGVLVGAGICAGLFLLLQRPTDANQNIRLHDDSQASLVSHSATETENVTQDAAHEGRIAFHSVRTLADTLAFETDFDQTVALYTLLERADEEVVVDLIQEADSISPPSQRVAALSIIFSKYATIDPYRALEHAEILEEHLYFRMLPSIFHAWSRTNLEESMIAAVALEGNRKRSAGYVILTSRDDLEHNRRMEIAVRFDLLRELAELNRQSWLQEHLEDPKSAWYESLQSNVHYVQTTTTRTAIARAWIYKDGIEVLSEIITTLPDEAEKESIFSSLLPWLVSTDPEGTLNVISTHSNIQDTSNLTYDVFLSWGHVDPESAFVELQRREVRHKSSLSDQILHEWVHRSPRDVLARADSLPAYWQNEARERAIAALARLSPNEAISLLKQLPDLEQRDDVAGWVARTWAQNDPNSALDWYLSLDMEESSARLSRARELTIRLTEKDPNQALKVATQTSGDLGIAMVSSVFNELADRDARNALQYVPRLNDEHKKVAMRSIGLQAAKVDIREAIKLSSHLDETIRKPYDDAVMDWALRASRARKTLIDFFDAIPDKKLKQLSAETLLYENEHEGFLSKAEREKMYFVLDQDRRKELDEYIASRREHVDMGPIRSH